MKICGGCLVDRVVDGVAKHHKHGDPSIHYAFCKCDECGEMANCADRPDLKMKTFSEGHPRIKQTVTAYTDSEGNTTEKVTTELKLVDPRSDEESKNE